MRGNRYADSSVRLSTLRMLVLLLAVILNADCAGRNAPPAGKKRPLKYLETGFKYSQLDRGFFQGQFSVYRDVRQAYAAFTQHEIAIGYSPWKNAFTFETNHRYTIFMLTIGGGAGYCATAGFRQSQFYFHPEVGLNLFYFQVYYTYSFTSNNIALYNTQSNFTLSIPICSTYRFRNWINFRWHWLGVYKGMEDPEDHDPQYGAIQ